MCDIYLHCNILTYWLYQRTVYTFKHFFFLTEKLNRGALEELFHSRLHFSYCTCGSHVEDFYRRGVVKSYWHYLVTNDQNIDIYYGKIQVVDPMFLGKHYVCNCFITSLPKDCFKLYKTMFRKFS